MKYGLLIVLAICAGTAYSQNKYSISIVQDSIRSSFRGLSVVSDDIVWVSGSNGTVGRTTNGGKTWQWLSVPGFEKRDFRDIEAFDSLTAVIMAVDNPADILKTTDGGKSWKTVFHHQQEGMFLDAMDFSGNFGICIGDALASTSDSIAKFVLLRTYNRGDSWEWTKFQPRQLNNESIFAGSGTNISFLKRKDALAAFITGGSIPRLVIITGDEMDNYSNIPLPGGAAAGAFSMYTNKINSFYITGGDYKEYWKDSGNVVFTTDMGGTWHRSSVHGYRSCIMQYNKKTFITCGINGVDISRDGCKNWQLIYGDGAKGKTGFNVCAKSKDGKVVYFAGVGNIGKLVW